MPNSVWQLLESSARDQGARPAIKDASKAWTYEEWFVHCRKLAQGLLDIGLRPGDRLAIHAANREEYLSCYFAAAATGLILVPLNTRLTDGETKDILRDSGCSLVLGKGIWSFEEERYGRLLTAKGENLQPIAAADETPAQIYYTSGTTGRPKGVILTHGNLLSHAQMSIAALQLSKTDVWAHVAPLFHLADAWATFAITAVAGSHVLQSEFAAEATLELIAAERISITNLVPTMLNRMVRHPRAGNYDYSSLRLLLSGGAPIASRVVAETHAVLGCEYVQTYGLTETSPFLTMSILPQHLRALPDAEQLAYRAKTGRPLPGIDLQIVDADGRQVEADSKQVGEIRVRGRTVSPGYWQNPEADAESFRDGWFYTGDLAVLDGEGFVDIVDRKKDVIISGGESVYSTEVEQRLFEHPAVLEAAVYGREDPEWGERICAAVVLEAGEDLSAEELIAFCRQELAPFKTPKEIRFMAELPRTGSGKISKRLLRSS